MTRAILTSIFAFAIAAIPAGQAAAEELTIDKTAWLSTGPDNSLDRAARLFAFRNGLIRTRSDETNIHSHYKDAALARLKSYTYTGEMRMAEDGSGVGVTFHSKYKNSDTYYRLRTFGADSTFHIAPHPDGVQLITEGEDDTRVLAEGGVWYRFKILVRTTALRTRIRAKIWRAKRSEPAGWQVDCSDTSEIRIRRGRVGVWAAGEGLRSWRNLDVETLD